MPRHRISDAKVAKCLVIVLVTRMNEWIDNTLVVAVKRGNPPIPPNPDDVYLCSQMPRHRISDASD